MAPNMTGLTSRLLGVVGQIRPHCGKWVVAALLYFCFSANVSFAGHGQRLYNELLDSDLLYPDHDWQDYMQEIGDRLLENVQSKKTFTFVLVDLPDVNAMALEDGYIFVFRGLLHYVNEEGQLAAVIGHEIGHVVAKHHEEGRLRSQLGQLAGLAGYGITGRRELRTVASWTFGAAQANYGREGELEADRIGAELLAKSGYNPLAVIDTVHVLKDQELFAKQVENKTVPYHSLFATHPKKDKRLHDAVGVARDLMTEFERPSVRNFWEMIDGVSFRNEGATGTVRETTYYNTTIRAVIEFPAGWIVSFNNREVYGESKSGPDDSWARVTKVDNGEMYKPSVFAKKTLKREDITEESTLQVGEKEFYVADLDTSASDSKRSVLGLVYRNREVFAVRLECGITCDEEQFEKDIETVLAGLRPMTPEDRAMITSSRIHVITAIPGDTYAKLAERSSLRSYPEETLRLLNGDYPHGEPRAGNSIKIVQ